MGESYAVTLPLYLPAPSNTAPHEFGASRTTSRLYISRLAPQPCGMPYICPSTEFHDLSLRKSEIGRVVGHQIGVDRGDVTGVDQPQRRVAGCRDPVVLAGAHQLDHFVGRVAELDVDLAAGLLLERRDPVDGLVVGAVLGIARPRDDVELALRRCRPRSAAPSSAVSAPV